MMKNLKTKMLTILLTPVVILIGMLSFYAYHTANNALEKEILDAGKYRTGYFSEQFNQTLLKQEAVVNHIVAIFATQNITKEDYQNVVLSARNSNPDILNVVIGFEDKQLVNSDGSIPPVGYDPRARDWYKKGMASDKISYSEVYKDAATGNLMVTMSKGIVVNGKKLGLQL